MLQSSASNFLNILSSKPMVTENAASSASSASPVSSQGAEFNRIYADVERGNGVASELSGQSGEAGTSYQLDLFAASEAIVSSLAVLTGKDENTLIEGQIAADFQLDAGNVLPFQALMPVQSLVQNPAQDAGLEEGWQNLLPPSAATGSSPGAVIQPLVSDGGFALSGLSPFVSPQSADYAALDPALSSPAQATQTMLTPTQMTTVATDAGLTGTVQGPSFEIDSQSTGLVAVNEAASELPETAAKTGQFVPPGLAQAISQGARAGVKSAAIDGVPAHSVNSANVGDLARDLAQSDLPPEGLDQQWLERIRQFQEAKQGKGSEPSYSNYDSAAFTDAYVASGDMSLDSSIPDADSLFNAAFKELGADTLQDKTTGVTANLNNLTGAQVRTADSAVKTYTTMLHQPVSDERWIDNMGEKIVWLSGRNIQSAEIHLNPAELGPVDVKVQVENDKTTVTFTVQNASVRELLESNVHRLRELMEGNGVNLKDVQVGADSAGQQQAFAREGDSENGAGRSGSAQDGSDDSSDDSLTELGSTVVSSRSVIDFYA